MDDPQSAVWQESHRILGAVNGTMCPCDVVKTRYTGRLLPRFDLRFGALCSQAVVNNDSGPHQYEVLGVVQGDQIDSLCPNMA